MPGANPGVGEGMPMNAMPGTPYDGSMPPIGMASGMYGHGPAMQDYGIPTGLPVMQGNSMASPMHRHHPPMALPGSMMPGYPMGHANPYAYGGPTPLGYGPMGPGMAPGMAPGMGMGPGMGPSAMGFGAMGPGAMVLGAMGPGAMVPGGLNNGQMGPNGLMATRGPGGAYYTPDGKKLLTLDEEEKPRGKCKCGGCPQYMRYEFASDCAFCGDRANHHLVVRFMLSL